jgi:hypothetical protein
VIKWQLAKTIKNEITQRQECCSLTIQFHLGSRFFGSQHAADINDTPLKRKKWLTMAFGGTFLAAHCCVRAPINRPHFPLRFASAKKRVGSFFILNTDVICTAGCFMRARKLRRHQKQESFSYHFIIIISTFWLHYIKRDDLGKRSRLGTITIRCVVYFKLFASAHSCLRAQ